MYPAPFGYHRAETVTEAIGLLADIGDGARALAGGQTLLVWLKMRFDEPTDLVDLARIPGLNQIESNRDVHIGALATHALIARSELARSVPIIADCANGIADNQVRSRGTIGGSLAAGDPSCDWPALLHTLDAQIDVQGPDGTRSIDINDFVEDLYQTALQPAELITGVRFKPPANGSAGAYCAFKRCAPAYPTASAGVQLTLRGGDTVEDVRVAMGSAGLTPIRAKDAEAELRGNALTEDVIGKAAEAAVAATDPIDDQRGSMEFKQQILRTLVKRAIGIAQRRCNGETVENHHEYY
jgi:carbon-monoxide dehydrogenase medium subunit